eukprot:TRINITY_DN3253_c0_g1_i1.p1 TRINITY_DN3253_c0_g1~~TRINITY_DN3253_c0_g1_i1.p1  ORF type:complete len:389 (-),score=68.26 TRINITY_DN3253_c0_g1_i1:46-1212(-)
MNGNHGKMSLFFFIFTIFCVENVESTLGITIPGSWSDDKGNLIQSHAPGIVLVEGLYYMHGENKTSGSPFQSIPCYSSRDLVVWTFVKDSLTLQKNGDLGPNRIVERPKVIYNEKNKQYVMHMHIDSMDYQEARFGTAVSSSICGPYTYIGSKRPFGNLSRDMGLFKDEDKKAYLLSEDRVNGLQIYQLDDNYIDVYGNSSLVTFHHHDFEAPALFKYEEIYYLLGSHLTGWGTNDNMYTTSNSMAGPWNTWKTFTPVGSRTFDSQTTFVLPVKGTKQTTFVFMSDRWFPNDLKHSQYIWLPIEVSKGRMKVKWEGSWSLNVNTGEWKSGIEEYYQAESGLNSITECDQLVEDPSWMDGYAIQLCNSVGNGFGTAAGFPRSRVWDASP